MTVTPSRVLDAGDLQALLDAVTIAGYQPIGPTAHGAGIEYAPIASTDDLPIGLVDTAEAGTYALEESGTPTFFGPLMADQSWKRYLYPPREQLITITTTNGTPTFTSVVPEPPRYAFIGVRACELAAIAIQDKVFLDPDYADPRYAARRQDLLVVAVECTRAGNTCFCVSMGTGPSVNEGADLVLTEVVDGDDHWFGIRAGSEIGEELIATLPTTEAAEAHAAECERRVTEAASSMGRTLDTEGIHDLLLGNPTHPRWRAIGDRCLACTNCTMVCPTCFCSTTIDGSALDGSGFTRERRWDSCFSLDYSTMHGHPVRSSISARYRKWLTHKFAGWVDQFGTSGCVGCGRCITWCPVGIDVTQEVAAIRDAVEVRA